MSRAGATLEKSAVRPSQALSPLSIIKIKHEK